MLHTHHYIWWTNIDSIFYSEIEVSNLNQVREPHFQSLLDQVNVWKITKASGATALETQSTDISHQLNPTRHHCSSYSHLIDMESI